MPSLKRLRRLAAAPMWSAIRSTQRFRRRRWVAISARGTLELAHLRPILRLLVGDPRLELVVVDQGKLRLDPRLREELRADGVRLFGRWFAENLIRWDLDIQPDRWGAEAIPFAR